MIIYTWDYYVWSYVMYMNDRGKYGLGNMWQNCSKPIFLPNWPNSFITAFDRMKEYRCTSNGTLTPKSAPLMGP